MGDKMQGKLGRRRLGREQQRGTRLLGEGKRKGTSLFDALIFTLHGSI